MRPHHRDQARPGQDHAGQSGLHYEPLDLPPATGGLGIAAAKSPEIYQKGATVKPKSGSIPAKANVRRQKRSDPGVVGGVLVLTFAAFANAGFLPRVALADDAASLLRKADAIRNPQTSFSAQVELKNYKKGVLTEQSQVTVFSRRSLEQFQSLVYINAPSADRGKIVLRNGDNLWIFDPASQASVRISAQQRLLGNASNGDVVASNLLGDYTPTLAGEEQVADGDRKIRECYKLTLASRDASTTYHSIEFWVDKAPSGPVKGKYYALSGNLLKVAWFRKDYLLNVKP